MLLGIQTDNERWNVDNLLQKYLNILILVENINQSIYQFWLQQSPACVASMSHVRHVSVLSRQWLATWHFKFVMIDDIDLIYDCFL